MAYFIINIESKDETLRLRLRVTKRKSFLTFFSCHSEVASATEESPPSCHSEARSAEESPPFLLRDSSGDLPPRNDKKGVILRLRQQPKNPLRSVILRLRQQPKNPLRSSFFSLKPAIRDSSGDLPPRNDKESVILSLSEAKGKNPLL